MYRRTLSAKLALYLIPATLLLATIASTISIYNDFTDYKQDVYQSINELLEATRSTASEAIFKLDTKIAQTLVDGVVANKYIIKGTLYDEHNNVLASSEELPKDIWRPLKLGNEVLKIDIEIENQLIVGSHEIVIDLESNLTGFYERAIFSLTTDFIQVLLIATLVYLMSVKLIARPVESLSKVVTAIPAGEKAPDIDLTKMDDEIGTLAKNTMNFINKSHEFAVQLELRQKERLHLEEQLRHSQKMDAVGQLAGGIAHDFNNIMTVVLGNVSLAEIFLENNNKEKLQQSLEGIQKSAERAAKLTKQLLVFSRKDLIQPEPINVNEAVETMSKMIAQLVPATFHVEYKLDAVKPIYADLSQIELILINLVINAKDALDKNGRINIECSNKVIDRDFVKENPVATEGEYVLLSVADNGSGISEDDIERIFDPFYTTKDVGKGTGLGLSTVFSIVETWHGFILVDTKVDEGTTFNIYLPHTDNKYYLKEDETEEEVIVDDNLSATVVICEDDDDVRGLIVELLSDTGLVIHDVNNPLLCIELCKSLEGKFDLLITDIIMPDMNGRELSESLADLYDFSTIFISGYSENIITENGIVDTDFSFIRKPFTKSELLVTIKEMLRKIG